MVVEDNMFDESQLASSMMVESESFYSSETMSNASSSGYKQNSKMLMN